MKLKVPWFLCGWSILLIFIFVSQQDITIYVYDCKSTIFNLRTFTYHMYHYDIEHIIFNLLCFWMFGSYITIVRNDVFNIITYTIGVLVCACSYYIQCFFVENGQSVIGASGGICAIVGAVFSISLKRLRDAFNEVKNDYPLKVKLQYSITKYNLSFIALFCAFGLMTMELSNYSTKGDISVSHSSHIVGLLSGIIVGITTKQ